MRNKFLFIPAAIFVAAAIVFAQPEVGPFYNTSAVASTSGYSTNQTLYSPTVVSGLTLYSTLNVQGIVGTSNGVASYYTAKGASNGVSTLTNTFGVDLRVVEMGAATTFFTNFDSSGNAWLTNGTTNQPGWLPAGGYINASANSTFIFHE